MDKNVNGTQSSIKNKDEDKKSLPIFVKYGIAAVALVVVIAVGLVIYLSSVGSYVATIGGQKVTTAEFKYYLGQQKSQMLSDAQKVDPNVNTTTFWNTKIGGKNALVVAKENTMDSLKSLKIQLIKAQEAKVSLTSDEISKQIDASINNIISQYGGGSRSKANTYVIQNAGVSLDDIRTMQLEVGTAQKFQASEISKIKVTDADIDKYYSQHPDWYKTSSMRTGGEEAVWVKHILISVDTNATQADKDKAKKQAEDILAQAKNGSDFAGLAKQYSADGNASNGGNYVFTKGVMVKEFEDAAFSLQPGQIYATPVQTQFGYHIIKLEEKYAKDQPVSLRCAKEDTTDFGLNFIKGNLYQDNVNTWKKDAKYNVQLNTKVYDSIS